MSVESEQKAQLSKLCLLRQRGRTNSLDKFKNLKHYNTNFTSLNLKRPTFEKYSPPMNAFEKYSSLSWTSGVLGFRKPEGSTYPSLGCIVLRLIVVSHPQNTDTHGRPLCHLSMIYKVLSAPRRLMYSFSVPRKPCIWISQHHILYLDHSNSTAKFSFANRAFFLSQHSVLILLADYYSYYLFPINFRGGRIFLSLLLTNTIVY